VADKSSYLQYLPPVLWQDEPPLPAFSLGAALRIFEKLLTGIDDGERIQHGTHDHEPVEAVIARLFRLFDPWTTPPEFLAWLASWVALEFPALWDEYQRRKITAEIVQVYRQRGLKAGLEQYLDLYTVAATRPRIAIDDCSRILFTTPVPNRLAPIYTLIAQGPAVNATDPGALAASGLVAPLALALAPDGSLLVADDGTPESWSPVVAKGVWRIQPPGDYVFAGATPQPQPIGLGPPAWSLEFPIAVAVDSAQPWNVYVLDRVLSPGSDALPALYRVPSPGLATATALATKAAPAGGLQPLGTVWPVAMAFDLNGHLLVLDRGTVPGDPSNPNPAAPVIIDVQNVQTGPPLIVTSRALTQVMEPLSLLVQPNGDLIIGDAREQNAATPADLVRVDRSNAMSWVESLLLAPMPAGTNPLVAPTAVVEDDADHLFVLDVGLKPLRPPLANPFLRQVAEPAVAYRVNLGPSPPVVTRATETQQLVFPTGMVRSADALYVCDRGEYSDPVLAGPLLRVWRALPNEFGVVVHFSEQRPATPLERRQIVQNIHDIIAGERPVHATWTLVYAV
jgi:phage tail-like protein